METSGSSKPVEALTIGGVKMILNELNGKKEMPNKALQFSLATTTPELDQAADVVARAFYDYALILWMWEEGSERVRHAMTKYFAKIVQRMCLNSGFIIVAKDETGRIVGVAQVEHRNPSKWMLMRAVQNTRNTMLFLGSIFFGRLGLPWFFYGEKVRLAAKRGRASDALEMHHGEVMDKIVGKHGEHLYLFQLASDPAVQCKGVGTSLLMVLGAIADRFKLQTYLETDTERHRQFYERSGYQVKVEYVIEDPAKRKDFAPNFGMVRPPAEPSALTLQ